MFSKASIAVFIMRITPNRSHRLVIYTALGVSIFCGLVFFFVALFQCTPVSYFWTRAGEGSCLSIDVIIDVVYAYSALSIITDFTFTLLPVYLVWNLQMDKRVKFALIPILSMGCVASCAVAVRMAYLENFHSNDFLCELLPICGLLSVNVYSSTPNYRLDYRHRHLVANRNGPRHHGR